MKVTCLSNTGTVLTTCDNFRIVEDFQPSRTVEPQRMYLIICYYNEPEGKNGGYVILGRYEYESNAIEALYKLQQFINQGASPYDIFEFPKDKKRGDRGMNSKKDFELDLLKEYQDDGCGGDYFDEVGMLIGMRMRGYFQNAKDDETIDELIEKHENAKS